METEKAYKEILEMVNKHRDLIVFNYNDLKQKADLHLFGLKLKNEYGLNIEPKDVHSLDYQRYHRDYGAIGWWGEKYRRTISWSDDGRQPEDELLFRLCFSTGAYIFGDDYPEELFKQFFLELKTYNPKYIDTINHQLFFSMDNASKIFNEFPEILKKYNEINKTDSKERKIKKLQEELKNLPCP